MTRRCALPHLAGMVMGLSALSSIRAADNDIPASDEENPALKPFDDLMTSFVSQHEVPGAALAVTKNSRLVYARGFGFADLEQKTPVQPEALFRIASVSKPITAVATLQLIEQNKFGLDDRFLDLFPIELPPDADPRVREITVRQLLQHTAGWDRDQSGDPIAKPRDVCRKLGIDLPPGPTEIIRYALLQPLDFAPGARYAYSNVGYLCLGRLIEKFTGKPYETAVKDAVLKPLGIRRMQLGKAREEERVAGEVRYVDRKNRKVRALTGPNRLVPLQYGGENFDNFEAHGGWIASAIDLVRFAAAFDQRAHSPLLPANMIQTMWDRPAGLAGYTPDGKPRDAYYACGWNVRPVGNRGINTWHTGLIAGTSSILVRRWDGLNWAVLFNTDRAPGQPGEVLAGLIDPLVHRAADAVRDWPAGDLFSR